MSATAVRERKKKKKNKKEKKEGGGKVMWVPLREVEGHPGPIPKAPEDVVIMVQAI